MANHRTPLLARLVLSTGVALALSAANAGEPAGRTGRVAITDCP